MTDPLDVEAIERRYAEPSWRIYARTDVPALIAEVRRLRAERDGLRAALTEAEEVFELSDPDGDRVWRDAPEDPAVLALCERHGFGAVIDSVVRQWRRRDSVGAYTAGSCVGTVRSTLALIRAALKGG